MLLSMGGIMSLGSIMRYLMRNEQRHSMCPS
jgi:hypothetical protein